MSKNIPTIAPVLSGAGLRIGVVMSRFNTPVCEGLRDVCLTELLTLGVAEQDIVLCSVAGALEIPVVLQTMAESDRFDGLIALGAVIRGDTYHFELVANESGAGVTRVGLDFGIAIANAILTTDTDEQAEIRIKEKGRDAARTVVETANLIKALQV
ncbi:6,7-dimethyl-8-ribityllumazine synthase [Deefgea salmonis]|uniref:6,7-dimethyl-8-ribityllumazine synthase n=2 Tax=Deefgea TaxID=400947 RepID=A0ABS8BH49_9NEIS|nr:6,7-dimethyl-8-ribityllumazine synthase [Deefgea salmonis]MCB5195041.1 6,7-dimethyl-8-ribityllumazine synthase [Deefgea salmonis]